MPVGIDHGAAQKVVLGSQHVALSVHLHQRGTVVAADVEHHAVGVGAVGHVTVHALAQQLGVIDDGRLLEVGKVALIDAHVTEHLVARSDAAIGESPLLQIVLADVHFEVFVLRPLAVLFHTDGKGEFAALISCRQRVPLINIETCPGIVGMQLAALGTLHHHIHGFHLLVAADIEIQGGNAVGNRHARIVGIDGRQLIHDRHILGS